MEILDTTINLLLLAVITVLLVEFLLPNMPQIVTAISNLLQTSSYPLQNYSIITSSQATIPGQESTTAVTTIQSSENYSALVNYTLGLINKDRAEYNLAPVSLSAEPSGQQHADSMLEYSYFSHWDIFGLKPYMRYTLLGGLGAVSENIAYRSSYVCVASLCTGSINPKYALQRMEYSMMYNDSACCNNGHRDNILNPYHNMVSIGIAYDSSRIYLVEDFINNYINWRAGYPAFYNGYVAIIGNLTKYNLSSILISYDKPVSGMTQLQLNATSDYSYGKVIAGVVPNASYYYSSVDTIYASIYSVKGNAFDIEFDMRNITDKYVAGEYTIMLWLNSNSANSFVGSTYTIFINSSGAQVFPSNV